MTAFIPEAHTLLTVEHTADAGRPAPRAACRAGACNSHHIVSLLFTHSPLDIHQAGWFVEGPSNHTSIRPSIRPSTHADNSSFNYPSIQPINYVSMYPFIHPSITHLHNQPAQSQQTRLATDDFFESPAVSIPAAVQCSMSADPMSAVYLTWPKPALTTFPMMTSCTRDGCRPARSNAAAANTNIEFLATLSAGCMHSFTGALGTQLQSSN